MRTGGERGGWGRWGGGEGEAKLESCLTST